MEEILNKLKRIITDRVGIDEEDIIPTANFKKDLSFDSLDEVEFLMDIESEFNISILDVKAEKIETVQEAIDLIIELTNN